MTARNLIASDLIEQLASLIEAGEAIVAAAVRVPPVYHQNGFSGQANEIRAGYNQIDQSRFIEWRTQAVSLLSYTVPETHLHFQMIKSVGVMKVEESSLKGAIAFARGIKTSVEKGFLGSLSTRIEAEVAADYIGMAERVLLESAGEKFHHVPAAMLIGAVLEKGLKDLCSRQEPPISILNDKGGCKTLSPLIDDLKKAGVFNELKAKQLRAWADIRNSAAHGQVEAFTVTDVEQMIQGVTKFLADYCS
jgi:hypothetical protein